MEEFSLYVLDITMNCVRAGASEIELSLLEECDGLTFTVSDNGCGMTSEQISRVTDPFFTTRETRSVGLGVPLLKMLAEQTGGTVAIESYPESECPRGHGTTLVATFDRSHMDFIPMGDLISTVVTLIQGSPDVNFTFTHTTEKGKVSLECAKLREVIGADVSLASFEVLEWIKGYLKKAYAEIDY